MKNQTVLLTGISGYIGLHCAQQLLEQGFHVRGSVRSKAKEEEVRKTLAAASVNTTNLTIVELDLTSDAGWENALIGCDYLMHVASPYTVADPKNENEMIVPAVEGTLRALRAAKKNGVKRVVLTSSALTMMETMKTGTFGPSDWTDTRSTGVSTYAKSKTLAEKAAWKFIENQNTDNPMEMVSVNPGGVFGPPLGKDISGQALTMIDQMLSGKIPMVANVALPMIDVRDIAQLHIQAMTNPNACGKRIVASHAKSTQISEVAQTLKEMGYKGPSTRVAPNFLIRFMSLFDREAKGMVGMLGMNLSADNSETLSLFNWKPRPVAESVRDSAVAVKAITGK